MPRRLFPSHCSTTLLDTAIPSGLVEPLTPSQPAPTILEVVDIISPLSPLITILDNADLVKVAAPIHRFLDRSSEQVMAHVIAQPAEALSEQTITSSSSSFASVAINVPNAIEAASALPKSMTYTADSVASSTPAHMANSLADDVKLLESSRAAYIQLLNASPVPATSSVSHTDQPLVRTFPHEIMDRVMFNPNLSINARATQYPTEVQDWIKICPCNLKGHPCPRHLACTHQRICFNRTFKSCNCGYLHILPTCKFVRTGTQCGYQQKGYPCKFGHDHPEARCLVESMEADHHGVKYGKYIHRFKGSEATETKNTNSLAQLVAIDEDSDSTTAVVEGSDGTTAVVEDYENMTTVLTDSRKTDFSFEGEEDVFKTNCGRASIAPTRRSA